MKIGITVNKKFQHYYEWIKGKDDFEVVKLSDTENNIEDCDGVILSGGVDMHPKFYQGDEEYEGMPKEFQEERDDFEISVLEKAIENNIPILGICRGHQLINVFCEGTLVQDLGEKKNETHLDTEEDNQHNVKVENGTILQSIVKVNSGMVNSAHHQSIQQLGKNLLANSYSEDGVIEGIEWKDKENRPFMLGVQWHPERMDKAGIPDSPFSKNVREYFISQVKLKVQK